MGLPGDADDLFAEARTAHEFALQHGSRGELPNAVLDSPKAGNLLLLVECGLGPEKYADGQEQELARFRPSSHPAARAQVFLDDRAAGHTQILTDVDYQARTRGGTEMEGIRKGKAVLKSTLRAAGVGALVWAANDDSHAGARDKWLVGMGLLLASALTQSAADVRHWPTLPSTVQVLALDVVPGEHALRIEFLDQAGNVLADLTQNWSVQVPAGSESWYIFRSLPGLDRFPRSIS
jgi:hypothetical protein